MIQTNKKKTKTQTKKKQKHKPQKSKKKTRVKKDERSERNSVTEAKVGVRATY